MLVLVSRPKLFAEFLPKPYTSPCLVNKYELYWLAFTDSIFVIFSFSLFFTSTGILLVVVFPFPNCPYVLFPHAYTLDLASNANIWLVPAAISVILLKFDTFSVKFLIFHTVPFSASK